VDLSTGVSLSDTLVWVSIGARAVWGAVFNPSLYLEAGFNPVYWRIGLWPNVGAGYTIALARRPKSRHGIHLFFGLPLPLVPPSSDAEGVLFVEPFYRPAYRLDVETGITHEFGVLVKAAF
jgi:hypothetical protein